MAADIERIQNQLGALCGAIAEGGTIHGVDSHTSDNRETVSTH
jgi:hypothetical protein